MFTRQRCLLNVYIGRYELRTQGCCDPEPMDTNGSRCRQVSSTRVRMFSVAMCKDNILHLFKFAIDNPVLSKVLYYDSSLIVHAHLLIYLKINSKPHHKSPLIGLRSIPDIYDNVVAWLTGNTTAKLVTINTVLW